MIKHVYLAALISCLVINPAYAERMQLEMIPLNHRTVNDIIPVLQPLLDEGGSISGMNNQLIIKSSPANLSELKQLLSSIDTPQRRLMIIVKQDINGRSNLNEQGLSGRYSNDGITISNQDGRSSREGIVVGARDANGNVIKYRNLSTESRGDDNNAYRVQTLEGQAAFIQSGQSVPVPNQTVYANRGNLVVQDSVEYRDVTSGFYVLPRLNGNTVTLLVSPQLARVNPQHGGVFDIQNVETTVTGRLGEWMQIGGLDQNSQSSSSGLLHSTRRENQEQRSVLIKVEEIP